MSDLRAIKTGSAGVTLLAVLAAAVGGCGSSGESTTDASSPDNTAAPAENGEQSRRDPCTPRRESGLVENQPRRARQGEAVPIEVGETKLTLEVERTALPQEIPIRFGERPPFKAREGSMLVAVTYRVANDGPDPVEPSESLNTQLLLRASSALYPYAAELPCGLPITASWALGQGGVNPAQPVNSSEEAATAVVFIVPKQKPRTRLSLVVLDQVEIALRPSA